MQLRITPKTKPSGSQLTKVDDLILKRKSGGSIIDQRPLFSKDGETVYIVWKKVIRAYSAKTGDFVKELEPAEHKIISITLSPENSDTILGCTDSGEILHWNSQNGLVTRRTKLLIDKKVKIKTFHIVHYTRLQEKYVCNAVVTYIVKENDAPALHIQMYDMILGTNTLSQKLNNFNEVYYIDIVGNGGENLIAIAYGRLLYILSPAYNLKFIRLKVAQYDRIDKDKTLSNKVERTVTCICGHPEEECVAIGDKSGRILLLRRFTLGDEEPPVIEVYHWHTLPVTEIVFSTSGSQMYSGGGECVLVKWTLKNKNRAYLPRLPAPIRHLTVAPEKGCVAVSTLDNGIIIVDAQNKLTAVIQNFTLGIASNPKSLFPGGLAVDPRTNSLVLNGRTGHIQFFNTHTKSLLYNFNITAQNLITQERSAIIVNTEVTRVAINDDGTWMATMEERDDSVSYTEVRLKFWEFSTDKQSFILNTSIEFPHEKGVNALKFRPKSSLTDNEQFVITVGKDDKFKVWHLAESTSDDKRQHWKCYSVGFYRNLSALDAGFSTDGSLIGVGFDSTLTLWVPETCVLKQSLSYCLYRQPIIRVEFGKQECCHLVVVASTEHLAVWDLLSLRIKWSVSLNLAILTADPLSVYMAAFTTDNTLVVFDPEHTDPVYIRKNVFENDVAVLAACFAPNLQDNEESSAVWQKKSQLYFLNSEQELLTLESESESNIQLENLSASRNLPLTAFSRITAAERITNTERPASYVHDYTRLSGKGAVEELLMTVPAHALPPMRMLCMPFLLSLMGTQNKKSKQSEKSTRSTVNVEEEELDSEDDEVTSEPFPLSKDKVDKDTKKEEQLVHFHWDREALF